MFGMNGVFTYQPVERYEAIMTLLFTFEEDLRCSCRAIRCVSSPTFFLLGLSKLSTGKTTSRLKSKKKNGCKIRATQP